MFDIKILGYSFYHEYNDKAYPIVKIEARYEDDLFIIPITFEKVYDAYDLVYNWINIIKDFVDRLWEEFHKGIPKAYGIRIDITLPIRPSMWIMEHIDNEFKKRLAIKREEDEFYRALCNRKFGLDIDIVPEEVRDKLVNKTWLVLGRGSGKWATQMKMLENYIKNGYVDTDACQILTKQEVEYMMNDRETVKNFVKERNALQIENVIFNNPATIVFWRDGSKTVVKAQDGEPFDPEKGLTMAIAKKVYGNKYDYYNTVKHWVKRYKPKEESDD